MPIEENPNEKKTAKPFEIEIYAELHNLISITDEFQATRAYQVILTKLLSVLQNINMEMARDYIRKMKAITAPNLKVEEASVLNQNGWDLIDEARGIQIPATFNNFREAQELFLRIQHRRINTELSELTVNVMQYLMSKGMFQYDAERMGELYTGLITGDFRSQKEL